MESVVDASADCRGCVRRTAAGTLRRSFCLASVFALVVSSLMSAPSAKADFNRIFFSIEGDTTQNSATQGDLFGWGCNCDSGATINWEVWYDVNANSLIDGETDILLTSQNITDGNALNEPDPLLDGYAISQISLLFAQPGPYVFRATDIETDSSLDRAASVAAMSAPPNQLSGHITLDGVSAPDDLLANRTVFAESDASEDGGFGVTDNTGSYTINMGEIGTGAEFFVIPSGVSGFVTPEDVSVIASGVVDNIDFMYEAAADSIWGYVIDEEGAVIPWETEIEAYSEPEDKSCITHDGRYAFYFAANENREWTLETQSRNSPVLLTPQEIIIDLDMVSSVRQDIILPRTDSKIYARIIENGNLPQTQYHLFAWSEALGSYAEGLSGIGTDSIATLDVSSLDPDDWQVGIVQWDDEYPIPDGLTVVGDAFNVEPGQTVTLELLGGCCYGRVGDANGSGAEEPTIGDISVLIDARFISVSCDGLIDCFAEADINGSGGANPTCNDLTIGDISMLIDYLFISLPDAFGPLPECQW